MKSPIILSGPPFPWHEPNPHGSPVDESGEVNWAAAAFADPGCLKCPGCGVYLWNEGLHVRCPDCGEEFDTNNKRPLDLEGRWDAVANASPADDMRTALEALRQARPNTTPEEFAELLKALAKQKRGGG